MVGMAKGRPPRAIEVKEQSGYYRKNPDRRPTTIIKGDSRLPVAPVYVTEDPESMAVWMETVDVLEQSGILSRTDTHLLAQYCCVYAQWVRMQRHITNHGVVGDDGKLSPEYKAFVQLSQQHAKLLPELGLSPSGRARLSTATSSPQKEKGGLADFLEEMKKLK